MIGNLSGVIIHKEDSSVIVDVHGVGYELLTPSLPPGKEVGSTVTLWIHTHVKEDALSLFGFQTRLERTIFRKLIGVSGVGPKTGVIIMTTASIESLATSIAKRDVSILTSVPGIGKKKAEKIAIELSDVFMKLSEGMTADDTSDDTLDALIALGYSQSESREAVKEIPSNLEDTQSRIRFALSSLSDSRN